MCDMLSQQDCVYTHIARGLSNGEPVVDKMIVDMISRCVKPYENYEEYLKLAENPDFRFIVSNTTESGIVYRKEDKLYSTILLKHINLMKT
jgi:tagaturonate reductase